MNWKSGLAALLIAGSAYAADAVRYFNDNHRKWDEGCKSAQVLREKAPKKMDEIERKVFEESAKDAKLKTTHSTSYQNWNIQDLADVLRTAGFYAERVTDVSSALELEYTGSEFSKYIPAVVDVLSENTNYVAFLKKNIQTEDFDCRAYSFTSAAVALNIMKKYTNAPKSLELVTGVLFHKTHAPDGLGHQWIKIDNDIIDPAIRDNAEKSYVPVIGVNIRRKKDDKGESIVNLSPKIYCLTQDLKNEK